MERTPLDLALRMLNAPSMATQVRGMVELVELVEMTQRASSYSYNRGAKAKWLNATWLSSYLVDSKLLDTLLGDGSTGAAPGAGGDAGGGCGAHPAVLAKAPPVLEFLTQQHKFSSAHMDRLWAMLADESRVRGRMPWRCLLCSACGAVPVACASVVLQAATAHVRC